MKIAPNTHVATRFALRVLAFGTVLAFASVPNALARWGGRIWRRSTVAAAEVTAAVALEVAASTVAAPTGSIAAALQSSGGSSWNRSSGGSSSYSGQHPSNSSSYNSSSSSNKQSDYNTYNANQQAEQQSKYNEANSLQHNQEETSEYEHTQTMNTVNNNVGKTNYYGGGGGGNPYYGGGYSYYGGGSSSNTGEVFGAAALGAVGCLVVGSMITSAAQYHAPTTTIVQTAPPYGYASAPPPLGTTLYSLPPGAYPATINDSNYYVVGSTYYKPYFNGSQIVYIVTQP